MAFTHDRKKHKRDVILIAAVLAAAVLLSAAMGIFNGGPGGTAVVTVDGREIVVLDLSQRSGADRRRRLRRKQPHKNTGRAGMGHGGHLPG